MSVLSRRQQRAWIPGVLMMGFCMAGCGREREIFLWGIGSMLFLVFSVVFALSLLIPWIVKKPTFVRVAEAARGPLSVLAVAIAAFGAIVIAVGIVRFTEEVGPRKLMLFLGVIIYTMGCYFRTMVITTDSARRVLAGKIVALCISFSLAMIYVISGAPMLHEP